MTQIDVHLLNDRNVCVLMQQLGVCLCLLVALIVIKLSRVTKVNLYFHRNEAVLKQRVAYLRIKDLNDEVMQLFLKIQIQLLSFDYMRL